MCICMQYILLISKVLSKVFITTLDVEKNEYIYYDSNNKMKNLPFVITQINGICEYRSKSSRTKYLTNYIPSLTICYGEYSISMWK